MELNGNRYLRLHAARAGTAMSHADSLYCGRFALPPPQGSTPAATSSQPALTAGSASSSSAIHAGHPSDSFVPRLAEEDHDL